MAIEMNLQNDSTIYNEGQSVRVIGIIESGSIVMKSKYFSLSLTSGQVMGLLHLNDCVALTTDVTIDDTTISAYRLENNFPNNNIFLNDQTLLTAAIETVKSQFGDLNKIYAQYKEQLKHAVQLHDSLTKKYVVLCEKLHVTPKISTPNSTGKVTQLLLETPYQIAYYKNLTQIFEQDSEALLTNHKAFVFGLLLKASQDANVFKKFIDDLGSTITHYVELFYNENYDDYFRYFSELLCRTHPGTEDYEEAKQLLTTLFAGLNQLPFIDKNALQIRIEDQKKKMLTPSVTQQSISTEQAPQAPISIESMLSDSMNKILTAANEDDEFVSLFTKDFLTYKGLPDKTINNSSIIQLRHKLTEDFHRLYANLALKYVTGEETSDVVKLFLTFGYIDEDLAGKENAEVLYKLLSADISAESEQIYTFIDWLKAIYEGKKEPGRNEFDMDYTDYLHSERVAGKISAQEEKTLLGNAKAKVEYELKNFFPTTNKITFGHISTYCPFFSSHNLIDGLNKGLLSVTRLIQQRDSVRNIDYQLFYKEIVYSNPNIGVNAEFLHKEILPDIILMPNYGSRGVMWQEVEGKKRATPCRMVLPIFTPENLRVMFLRLCGEYRWEMCKRTHGSHWNDPSSNSLTADYFDYIQFYRKNNDLSADAKEKVKLLITKARNSVKEAFVLDYIVWVAYESEGSPRLNKVARNILFNHCPFPGEIRKKLTVNPIYLSVIQRHASKYEQLSHRMKNLCTKITNAGKELPEEFKQEILFFDK